MPGAPQPPDEISIAQNSNVSSSLKQRLRSSFGASIMEAQHILEVLAQKENSLAEDILNHKTEIRQYQMEVNRHRAALVDLQNKQKGLEGWSKACRSLLAPIRRLPLEILREIFIHFCDEIQISSDKISVPGLKLAAVCGGWRDIVLSMSRLWTRIDIAISPDLLVIRRPRRIKLLIDLVLEHSRDAPLHLRLRESCVSGVVLPARQGAVVPILRTIARHSRRWCHLILELPDIFLHEIDHLIQDLPLLESLTVRHHIMPLDIVSIAPKLCHVELRCICKPTDLKLPWDQLSTLKIKLSTLESIVSEFPACLERCTGLQRLDVTLALDQGQDPLGDAHAIHNLESLSVEFIGSSDPEHLFSVLTLPQLTGLSIFCRDVVGWVWDETFVPIAENFFMRSACTITSLKLHWIPISDNKLISLLQLLPSIEELLIKQGEIYSDILRPPLSYNITDSLITSLHITHSGSGFTSEHVLPKLRALSLGMDHGQAPSCEALVELVNSRWIPDPVYAYDIGVVSLKSVEFNFWNGNLDYDFSSLVCLRDAGLEFTTSGTKK